MTDSIWYSSGRGIFFFNVTATTEIYTLSLHDALPIYPRFDFTEMAKRSLGRHWAGRTPEEQREFVTIFAAMLGRSYADNIESNTSQNVLYTRESEDQNYAQVDTKIVTENRPPLSINYKLQSVDKVWKVYTW